jgi:uncharacterized protein YdeI (YjbR/CyaY-like superfamily)
MTGVEPGRLGGTPQRPARFFDSAAEFRSWLERHHESETELWMGLSKKHVTPRGLVWEAAVREALCFGWIDSVVQRLDDDAIRQRWTPRKQGSTWSRINLAAVEELTAAGLMTPMGLAAYEARIEDRQAIYAYEQAEVGMPPEYAERLAADPAATLFWSMATPSYRKGATYWVLSAKQEATREARMAQLVADCASGQLIKPQRYGGEPTWVTKARAALSDGGPPQDDPSRAR